MASSTPRGYPYPGLPDAPNVPLSMQNLATAIDTDMSAQVNKRTPALTELTANVAVTSPDTTTWVDITGLNCTITVPSTGWYDLELYASLNSDVTAQYTVLAGIRQGSTVIQTAEVGFMVTTGTVRVMAAPKKRVQLTAGTYTFKGSLRGEFGSPYPHTTTVVASSTQTAWISALAC